MCFLCHASSVGNSLMLLNKVPALQPASGETPQSFQFRLTVVPRSVLCSAEALPFVSPKAFHSFFKALCSHRALIHHVVGFPPPSPIPVTFLNPPGRLSALTYMKPSVSCFWAPKCCIILKYSICIFVAFPSL